MENNNVIKIYHHNYNLSKIKLEIFKIIPLNNNNIKYLNNKEEDLDTRKLKEIGELNSFFIILIKMFNKYCASVKKNKK